MLTDGENNAGNISPEDAARLAQTLKVKVYTILAGDNESDARAGRAGGATPVNPKLLEQIASMTGGTPYLATDSRGAGGSLPEDPRGPEEVARSTIAALLYAELYRRFLLVAFALLAAEIALRLTRFSRIP